jgi:hypothetical protein
LCEFASLLSPASPPSEPEQLRRGRESQMEVRRA